MSSNVKNRIGFIGSTDAKRILDADWYNLWMEKTGRAKPEDLSHVFRVQLGIATEEFHRHWLYKHSEFRSQVVPDVSINPLHNWLRSHLDAWLPDHRTFLELKHCHARMTAWEAAEYYQPQIAHHCLVMKTTHGWLSFIPGNEEPVVVKVEPTPEYLATLFELEKTFWWHVTSDTPPEQLPTETIAKAERAGVRIVVDGMRRVDMKGNNAWADAAERFTMNKEAAKSHEKAKKELKELVPADAAECSGYGVTIKRDRKGSMRFVGAGDD